MKLPLILLLIMQVGALYAQKDGPQPTKSGDFVYPDCGCSGTINLTIHNGLYDVYGGQIVPDAEEESKGAVTVANLNDTDGDIVVDNADDNVSMSTKERRINNCPEFR